MWTCASLRRHRVTGNFSWTSVR